MKIFVFIVSTFVYVLLRLNFKQKEHLRKIGLLFKKRTHLTLEALLHLIKQLRLHYVSIYVNCNQNWFINESARNILAEKSPYMTCDVTQRSLKTKFPYIDMKKLKKNVLMWPSMTYEVILYKMGNLHL